MTDGASLVSGDNDPSESNERVEVDLVHETERAALIKEYDFVSSLIPMYRRLEIQAVQLSLIIVVAATGFIGEALRDNKPAAYFAAAALPLLLSFILLAICGMEVRIVRASRFLDRSIGQRLKELTGREVLKWERSPGLHLDRLQRRFQSSWTYILIIVVPGLLGASGAIWGALNEFGAETEDAEQGWLLLLTAFGLCLLLIWGVAAVRISGRHEGRGLSLKGLWTRSLRVLPGIPASDVQHEKDCPRVELVLETPGDGQSRIYQCAGCGRGTNLKRIAPGRWIGIHEDTSKEEKAISLGVAGGKDEEVASVCEVVAPYGQLSISEKAVDAVAGGEKLLYPTDDFDNAPQRPLDDGTYRVRWFAATDIGRRLTTEDAFEIRDGRIAW